MNIIMEQTKKDFTEQEIAKYLTSELSKEESVEIETWINKDPENKKKFLESKCIWELSGQVKESKLIDIELARSKVIKRLHGFGRQKNFFTFLTKVAAILFLPLLITSMVYLFYKHSSAEIQEFYSEINVSYGTVTHFVLSDGTNVWLNSGSHFGYPTQFTGASREVYLEGEAYFEVADSRKPFVVRTRQMEVVAEGTSFNIAAYPDDEMILTTLVDGKVTLYKLIPDSKPIILTELVPNENATYYTRKNEVIISTTNVKENISWKDGKLIFDNDSFEEIVGKLGRWYNTDIRLIDPELKTYSYTATFTDETLLQVLELLEKSAPITYTYSQRTKKQDGTFLKKRVEIKMKK
jgi:ferric-dicitrate binding protein FerR (iron transport regulator)